MRIARSYVRRLARSIRIRQAILTGSWATGLYLEDSDVDLIIVSDDFSKMSLSERLISPETVEEENSFRGVWLHCKRVSKPPTEEYVRKGRCPWRNSTTRPGQ